MVPTGISAQIAIDFGITITLRGFPAYKPLLFHLCNVVRAKISVFGKPHREGSAREGPAVPASRFPD